MSPSEEQAPSGAVPTGGAGSRPGSRAERQPLRIALGQYAEPGRKDEMGDFHGAVLPEGAALTLKGAAIVTADGISSSPLGGRAAETAVKAFLSDYYDTPDGWTAREAAARVIRATNAWLHAETHRQELARERGHVCTFEALILKGRTAHLFHVGDSRVWRLTETTLEPLTEDHRLRLSAHEGVLARALGMERDVEIDHRALPLTPGDVFALTTDGVHGPLPPREMAAIVAAAPPDAAARELVAAARRAGGSDDATAQVVRVEAVPEPAPTDLLEGATDLPPAPALEGRVELDGWRLLRRLHISARSHVWLVEDSDTGLRAALKIPARGAQQDHEHLRRLLMEEWVARRASSPHLLSAPQATRPRSCLYAVTEHVEGKTLRQWMIDHPTPSLEEVRALVDQLVAGLRALHRRGIIHQDLRPENVLIDTAGTARIVDYGSAKIEGLGEAIPEAAGSDELLGTLQYTAPECLLGHPASPRSDQFSLGVLAYEMLSGRLPYGAAAARVQDQRGLRRLAWRPAGTRLHPVPAWIDAALARAAAPRPEARFAALSEFAAALRRPDSRLVPRPGTPLAERDPVRFWQAIATFLAALVAILLATR